MPGPSSIRQWLLTEGSGTTSAELNGSGDALTITSPNWVSYGIGISTPSIKSPFALSFESGLSSAVNGVAAGGLGNNPATATLNFWAYTSGGTDSFAVGFNDTTGYRFSVVMNSGVAYFCAEQFGVGSFPNLSYSLVGWHMVTLVFDGSLSGAARSACYIDGVPQALIFGGSNPPPTLDVASQIGLFRLASAPANAATYAGGLSDVILDNTAWTQAQITSVFNAAFTSPNTIYLYAGEPNSKNIRLNDPTQPIKSYGLLIEAASALDTLSGGVVFSVTRTEAALATDTASSAARFSVARTEAASAIDSASEVARLVVTRSEAGAALDNPSAATKFTVSRSEAASATDTASEVARFAVSRAESTTALDSPSASAKFPVTRTETASSTDNPSAATKFTVSRAEAAAATDAPAKAVLFTVSRAEAAAATDAPAKAVLFTVSRTEIASATDAASGITGTVVIVSRSEAALAVDALAAVARFIVTRTESASAVDHPSASAHFNVTRSETGVALDMASGIKVLAVVCAENVSAQDAADAVYTYFWYRSYRPGSQYRLYRGDPAYKAAVPVARLQPVGIPAPQ